MFVDNATHPIATPQFWDAKYAAGPKRDNPIMHTAGAMVSGVTNRSITPVKPKGQTIVIIFTAAEGALLRNTPASFFKIPKECPGPGQSQADPDADKDLNPNVNQYHNPNPELLQN